MGVYASNGMYYISRLEYKLSKDPLYFEKKRVRGEEHARKKVIAENNALERDYNRALSTIEKASEKEFQSIQKIIDKDDNKKTQDMVKRHFGRELPIDKMRAQGYDHAKIRETISNYEAAIAPGSKISPENKKKYKDAFKQMEITGLQTLGEIPRSQNAKFVSQKTKIPYLKEFLELEPVIDTAKKMGLSGPLLDEYEDDISGIPGNLAFKWAYEKNSKNPEKELLKYYGKIDESRMKSATGSLRGLRRIIENYKKAKDPASGMTTGERYRAISAISEFKEPVPPTYEDVPAVKPSRYVW